MFARILCASLVALVCSTAAFADVHRNKTHKFEANFPSNAESMIRNLDGGTRMELARSKVEDKTFLVGVIILDGASLQPSQLKACASEFIAGIMEDLNQAQIIKEGEVKINNRCRNGYGVLIKYETGVQFNWVTVQNGKLYCVTVHAASKDELNTPQVNNFLESVRIETDKDVKDSE